MRLSQVAAVLNGDIVGHEVVLNGISINTRDDCTGRLFVALKGENFDAHEYVDQAERAGALALVLERNVESTLPSIVVDDTHQALKVLASWWRSQFVIPVIGITGSVGKTSVKEMLACIFAQAFAQTGEGIVTHGNLNNEIGVPLTLMRLLPKHHYAIVEMGMNHAGEISRITNMAKPTVALVNNAGAAHLEGLGSIEAVAHAKGEIFEGLSADGVAIINHDDDFADLWHELAKRHKVISFALKSDADVTATYVSNESGLELAVSAFDESCKIELSALGEHNARNALAAIATALAANIPLSKIQAGLEAYRPISGRLNVSTINGTVLIDDTYNANPASMLAAIKVLTAYSDNTFIVGDMAELGAASESEHKQLGETAAKCGVTRLFACGEYASFVVDNYLLNASGKAQAKAFKQQNDLIDYVRKQGINQGAILVKGSRSAKMENVVIALNETLQTGSATSMGEQTC